VSAMKYLPVAIKVTALGSISLPPDYCTASYISKCTWMADKPFRLKKSTVISNMYITILSQHNTILDLQQWSFPLYFKWEKLLKKLSVYLVTYILKIISYIFLC